MTAITRRQFIASAGLLGSALVGVPAASAATKRRLEVTGGPVSTGRPVITGAAQVGSTLSASEGNWT